jgi:hypothetical protein
MPGLTREYSLNPGENAEGNEADSVDHRRTIFKDVRDNRSSELWRPTKKRVRETNRTVMIDWSPKDGVVRRSFSADTAEMLDTLWEWVRSPNRR